MRNKPFLTLLLLLLTTLSWAERREVHILAVNDMHASVDAMPKLAAIADSLRALYPSLLILSAGDNRTGDPVSDMYKPSGYPMVALMNQIGFDASAIGNHEFDVNSLPALCPLSTFPYLCANITADDSTGIRALPYKLFDVDGVKLAVIGVVQIGANGMPDAHPNCLRGMRFESPLEAVRRYEWLHDKCDATILLSHAGYQDDIKIAGECPWLDLIVGGHTHRQLSENEPLHNGVLITQNRNLLSQCTHIILTVDSGRVVSKQTDYMNVRSRKQQNAVVAAMVRNYNSNPYFKQVLTQAETPFQTRNEIGTMVCDALCSETGADIAIMNYRGIRVRSHKAGNITVGDALEIDPFGNNAVLASMTGAELERFIVDYGRMNVYHFPHLSGMSADLLVDKDDPSNILKVTLRGADGKPLNKKKTYVVVTNTYVTAKGGKYAPTDTQVLERTTSDIVMAYLQKQKTVSYQGKGSLHYIRTK